MPKASVVVRDGAARCGTVLLLDGADVWIWKAVSRFGSRFGIAVDLLPL